MALLTFRNVSLAYGMTPLLDNVSFGIDKGERIALIGRNGAGKSSLMRVLNHEVKADGGDVIYNTGVRVASLPQEVPQQLSGSVLDIVLGGGGVVAELLHRYHHCDPQSALFNHLHEQIDAQKGWDLESRALREISRLELTPDADFAALSGGLKRRALLARALLLSPDILLLDEPTNHLDIRSIEWLESFLKNFSGAILFVTHDRAFLRSLATRIWELDRGTLRDFPCDMDNFERRKQEILHAEAKQNADFDKKLAQEEVWVRQGIKARRTRNEGRVRALEQLRRERAARREQLGKVSFTVQTAERSGKVVIECQHLGFSFGDKCIVRDFSTVIERGDKIAILGDNGVGKTTLLRLLLQQLAPTQGQVNIGTKLEIAYFDQLRNALDENGSVVDNIAEGADFIDVNGERRHVLSWLQDFLFSPQRARTPVSALSGGERNRLLLAKLFTKPCNLLVLDEPTNDLDVETLELLEELLLQFTGTVLLISHDREFVDKVATSVIAFEGNGNVEEYVGGYQDWLRQRTTTSSTKPEKSADIKHEKPAMPRAEKPKKMSYNDQRELDSLPAKIEQFEQQINALQSQLNDPELYRGDNQKATQLNQQLQQCETELSKAYERWEILEAQK